MILLFRIVLGVYLAAINFYSALLVVFQKRARDEDDPDAVRDGRLFVSAMLGGALGVLVMMFAKRYRLKNLFLMVFMPVLVAVNAYLVYLAYSTDFGFAALAEQAAMLPFP